jgi:uncharacterized membrane protein YdjX (TVP38/TMEM64 family)
MGAEIGDKGLERFASARRLQKVRRRVRSSGAIALAVLDLVPPPFPFTLFALAAGALHVNRRTFFLTLTVCRLFRFGGEAALAVVYGRHIVQWLESDLFHEIVVLSVALATIMTAVSIIGLIRSTKPGGRRHAAA